MILLILSIDIDLNKILILCVRQGNQGLFDVAMGAYDGVDVWELVGTYMLNLLSENIDV